MSSDQHFIGKVSLRPIITKDGKVLIDRDAQDADIWELPGGRLHVDEVPEEGLKREMKEELGIDIKIGTVIYVEQFKQTHTGEPSFLVVFEAKLKDEQVSFTFRDGEIAEVKWITKEQLFDQKIYDNCLNALKKYFNL